MDALEQLMQQKKALLEQIDAAEKTGDEETLTRCKRALLEVAQQIAKYDSPENKAEGFQQQPLIGYNYLDVEYPGMVSEEKRKKEKG